MAVLKCVQEGREGYHVGDYVEVPGRPDAVSPEFVILSEDEEKALKAPKTNGKKDS